MALSTILLIVAAVVVLLLGGLAALGVISGSGAANAMRADVEEVAQTYDATVEDGAGQAVWVMKGDGWTVTSRSTSARGPAIENGLTTVFHATSPSGGLVWAGPKSLTPAKDLKYLLDREVSNLAAASVGDASFEQTHQVFTAGGDASLVAPDVRAALLRIDGFHDTRALVWSGGAAIVAKGQVNRQDDLRALIDAGLALHGNTP